MHKLETWILDIASDRVYQDNMIKSDYISSRRIPVGGDIAIGGVAAMSGAGDVTYNSTNLNHSRISLTHNDSVNSSSVNTSDINRHPSEYQLYSVIIISIIVILIMLLIVLGNLLVIIAIAVDRHLKRIQNWFIASLALSDLLLGLLVMPLSLANELMGYWYFGDILCDIWLAVDVLLCTASILNLCLISLDRYWSITRAISYVRNRTKTRAMVMIALVWVLSTLICLPPLVYPGWNRPHSFIFGYPMCILNETLGYVIYSTMGSFYVPGIIMVVVYLKIYIAARSRARRGLKKAKQEKSAATTFTSVSLAQHAKVGTDSDEMCSEELSPTLAQKLNTSQSNSLNVPNQQLKAKDQSVEFNNKHAANSDSNIVDSEGDKGSALLPQDSHDPSSHEAESAANSTDSPSMPTPCRTNGVAHSTLSKAQSHSPNSCKPLNSADSKAKAFNPPSKLPKSIGEAEKHKRRVAKAKERRATIVLGIIMATFILCWLPFFSIYLISSIFNFYVDKMIFAIFFWAGYCNSALNPLIYTIFNREFRQGFHRIVFGRRDYRR